MVTLFAIIGLITVFYGINNLCIRCFNKSESE